MGAEVIILANPYTYNFLKGLTHGALTSSWFSTPSLTSDWILTPVSVCHKQDQPTIQKTT